MIFDEVKGAWKEDAMALWGYYPGIRLESMKKPTKICTHNQPEVWSRNVRHTNIQLSINVRLGLYILFDLDVQVVEGTSLLGCSTVAIVTDISKERR